MRHRPEKQTGHVSDVPCSWIWPLPVAVRQSSEQEMRSKLGGANAGDRIRSTKREGQRIDMYLDIDAIGNLMRSAKQESQAGHRPNLSRRVDGGVGMQRELNTRVYENIADHERPRRATRQPTEYRIAAKAEADASFEIIVITLDDQAGHVLNASANVRVDLRAGVAQADLERGFNLFLGTCRSSHHQSREKHPTQLLPHRRDPFDSLFFTLPWVSTKVRRSLRDATRRWEHLFTGDSWSG